MPGTVYPVGSGPGDPDLLTAIGAVTATRERVEASPANEVDEGGRR